MIKLRQCQIILLLTPVFIVLGHYSGYLHEFAHSFTAWSLGFKPDPLNIIYGGYNWKNLLLIWNVDENVDYHMLYANGYRLPMAFIAFAGPAISGLIYCLTLILMNTNTIKNPYFYYFIFWLNILNLAELYSYIPLRNFLTHGDIGNINHALDISGWWILSIFGPFILLAYIYSFTYLLPKTYTILKFDRIVDRIILLIIVAFMLLGYPATRILLQFINSALSNYLALISYLIMIVIIAICWPSRTWVQNHMSIIAKSN